MSTSFPSRAIPEMNWNAEDKIQAFTTFKKRMEMYLTVTKVDPEIQWNHIVLLMGEEGLRRWEVIDMSEVERKDPKKVWSAFEKSLEKTQSFWNYIDEYLSDFRQGPTETAAELDVRIQTLVRKCKFPPGEVENRKLELLYHATRHFEVKKYAKEKDRGDITYSTLLEQAKIHERVIQEYRDHKANSGEPVYTETKVNALQKHRGNGSGGFQDHQRRCGKCGTQHQPRKCPAFGTKCGKCGGKNHWQAVCRGRPRHRGRSSSRSTSRGSSASAERRGRSGSRRRRRFSRPFHKSRGRSTKKQSSVKRNEIHTDESDESPSAPPQDEDQVIRYTFRSIKGKSLRIYTDTAEDRTTEIITDVEVQLPHRNTLDNMEVKVDCGAEANILPLRCYRQMFPRSVDAEGYP